MSGEFTFTVKPTAEDVILGLLDHAWMFAAVMMLLGLLFHSWLMGRDEEDPPS
jgi:hypothetical protein